MPDLCRVLHAHRDLDIRRLRQCVALDVNLDARTQYLDPAVRRDSAREDTANAERAAGGDIAVRRKFLRCATAESRIYARNDRISHATRRSRDSAVDPNAADPAINAIRIPTPRTTRN